jgi:CRP/FNR family cyclic AMP-dependent transcriptional regulator
MDTTAFFTLPGDTPAPTPAPGFLPVATLDAVLGASETLRFHPGDVVLRAGERDRALYVLLDGRLEDAAAPALLGVAAFLDGRPRTATFRARGHGELARMSWDAYEALAARDPRLGRTILLDLARVLAEQLREARLPGWTG